MAKRLSIINTIYIKSIKFEKIIETKKDAYPSTKSTPSVSEKRKGVDGAEAD